MLLQLCHELGLDYGELDVLINVDDGKVYIVAVNNTPFGPPKILDSRSAALALESLSGALADSYGPTS